MLTYDLIPGAFHVPAKEAVFSPSPSVTFDNNTAVTSYDPKHGLIRDLGTGCTVTYPMTDPPCGTFDLYLSLSKVAAQWGSQFFDFRLGEGDLFSVPTECDIPLDSPIRYIADGDSAHTGHWYDTGLFPVMRNVSFDGATSFSVTAAYGAKHKALSALIYPALGDLLLVPAGTSVPVGHRKLAPPAGPHREICWIGSSVTYGHSSCGHYSMADALAALYGDMTFSKFAVSGTTLVNDSPDSYVARIRLIPKDYHPDAVIVQLSTNDASKGKPFGNVTSARAGFDDTTIAGAMETIITYIRKTFNCPVLFYSGSYYESEAYAKMVDLMHQIADKWDMPVIDLFSDPDMQKAYDTPYYHEVMSDPIHPKKRGYSEWWAPKMKEVLDRIL